MTNEEILKQYGGASRNFPGKSSAMRRKLASPSSTSKGLPSHQERVPGLPMISDLETDDIGEYFERGEVPETWNAYRASLREDY